MKRSRRNARRVLYLDGPPQLGLGEAQPQHPGDGHAHTEPGEEAEEVDDGEDVLGDGVHHGQHTLMKRGRKEDGRKVGRMKKVSVLLASLASSR